jgi:hypothetical protein
MVAESTFELAFARIAVVMSGLQSSNMAAK